MQVKREKILQDFADAEAEVHRKLNAATDAASQTALTQELEGLRQKRRNVELTACGGEFLPSSLSPIGDVTGPGGDDV
jgi:transcription elongation GreA/GreB family factor